MPRRRRPSRARRAPPRRVSRARPSSIAVVAARGLRIAALDPGAVAQLLEPRLERLLGLSRGAAGLRGQQVLKLERVAVEVVQLGLIGRLAGVAALVRDQRMLDVDVGRRPDAEEGAARAQLARHALLLELDRDSPVRQPARRVATHQVEQRAAILDATPAGRGAWLGAGQLEQ